MPRQDKTGPLGQGALTGRGLGLCGAGVNRNFGRGMGRGKGIGRGRGFRQIAQPVELSEVEEKKVLEAELKELGTEKAEIEKRLKELKK